MASDAFQTEKQSHTVSKDDGFNIQTILKGTICFVGDTEEGAYGIEGADKKCVWLRSQLIGSSTEIDTPFGKRILTYADHTASGRSLEHVENYVHHIVLPLYGNTHTDDSFVGQRMGKMVKEATKYIKTCLGSSSGTEEILLLCGNGTTGAIKRLHEVMGVAIPSTLRSRYLEALILKPEERWVVFVGPYEHHSNLLSWRQSLAEVVEIGVDDEGLIDMNMLHKKLEEATRRGNRPMLGSFSACSNVTGICTDTRAIARLLHEYGAFACFDFAASGPYVKIDMRCGELDGYDVIFMSPHKFVGGPGTPGILLMSKALYLLSSHPPSTCGGGTVSYVNGFNEEDTLYCEDIEEREGAGTPSIIQTIRAALAFWIKEYMGHSLIESREQVLLQRALARILPNANISILGNTHVKRLPIISFLIYTTSLDGHCEKDLSSKKDNICISKERSIRKEKPLHCRFVAKLLNDLFGIQARGGCACAGPYGHLLMNIGKEESLSIRSGIQKGYNGLKPGWTRINFAYYISDEEFEFILAAMEFIALHGQRFLPLYRFNWMIGDWTLRQGTSKVGGMVEKMFLSFDRLRLLVAGGQISNDEKESVLLRTVSENNRRLEQMYAAYLDNARLFASFLLEFPTERQIPQDIDPDLVHFRV
ncbi:uncharacterized protein LOC18448307 [Amborella trichopoda]|uniref:uncharacterized protein LOC18448307 n=1 Tax=Amborella trichopoda TaxID=13333 RepID=UPI0009C087FF|nr:uncharacterized protein LOC18448307 [Amborella trichopoda]|eukprot:XP_020531705.1 uncharacterized protein LOC18448307 [Amborella trichopoda]